MYTIKTSQKIKPNDVRKYYSGEGQQEQWNMEVKYSITIPELDSCSKELEYLITHGAKVRAATLIREDFVLTEKSKPSEWEDYLSGWAGHEFSPEELQPQGRGGANGQSAELRKLCKQLGITVEQAMGIISEHAKK